ncbi:hypothetical protein SAMN05216241_1036 [Limimonas halophila]|uniref:Bacteriophage holin of superfamily 6 (Holin_LLH) n=1 Tax=Limimonas halophila TaxID=1082479 RepID=A0A1G7PQV6_9PROT|nr:hypothetical protein [Limimonas halophila]SDF87989.1 hypothetical protein SAMN05216241_1036 [Limimonas halophila]
MLDLSPLITTGANLLEPALLAIASWVAAELAALIGARTSSELAGVVDDALGKAVRYAVDRARDEGKDVATVPVKNEVIREAVSFAAEAAPKALKKLGLNPGTEQGRARIAKWVRARLPEA